MKISTLLRAAGAPYTHCLAAAVADTLRWMRWNFAFPATENTVRATFVGHQVALVASPGTSEGRRSATVVRSATEAPKAEPSTIPLLGDLRLEFIPRDIRRQADDAWARWHSELCAMCGCSPCRGSGPCVASRRLAAAFGAMGGQS